MKNKLQIILLALVLALSLVACGKTDEAVEDTTGNTTNAQAEQGTADEKEGLDGSLEGDTLLKTLSNERPDQLMMKSELTSFGTTTQMTTYYDGVNARTEMDVPNMAKSILIHLPEEGIMYSYVYGESTGVKMTGANTTYAEEMGLMMDTSMFADLVNASSKDMTAKVDTLDGEEVIYLEATQPDDELGEVLVKMWYSDKYATPLKYEVIMGQQPLASLVVTEISDDVNMDKSLFQAPSDVTFTEVDMESMMENW